MTDKIAEAHRMMCEAIKAAAEAKLGRPLSQAEEESIQNVPSLMMLESIERRFSHPSTSAEEAVKELAHFSTYKGQSR